MGEKSKPTFLQSRKLPYKEALTLPLYRAFEESEDRGTRLSSLMLLLYYYNTVMRQSQP